MALTAGRAGERYAIVGPYLSYADLARLVGRITGRPRIIMPVPERLERPLQALANLIQHLGLGTELSAATVAGGFLQLHVAGTRADDCFGLVHPPSLETIRSAFENKARR